MKDFILNIFTWAAITSIIAVVSMWCLSVLSFAIPFVYMWVASIVGCSAVFGVSTLLGNVFGVERID